MILFSQVSLHDLPVNVIAVRAVGGSEIIFDGDESRRAHGLMLLRAAVHPREHLCQWDHHSRGFGGKHEIFRFAQSACYPLPGPTPAWVD